MTSDALAKAEAALEAVRAMHLALGNGPVWEWANDVRAPDRTTDACDTVGRALGDLFREIKGDVVTLYAKEA